MADFYRRVVISTTTPRLRAALGGLHRPLLVMVAVMCGLVLVSLCGMVVDHRRLLGVSIWLKPLKFGVAFVLYGSTLAWLLSLPHKGSRWTWWLGTTFAVAAVVDVGFIAMQAARGTFSHFNSETDPINSIGQIVFTSGIPGLFLANLVIAVIISWQRVADKPISLAIHSGLGIAVVGMALGYLMGFTGSELVRTADGAVVELVGKHTVDADDGTGGMPVTDWSTVGGDLRIPHFLGLHGIQLLLLAAVLTAAAARKHAWLRPERTRAALIGVFAAGYVGLMAVTTWQALRGQPLIHPDSATWLGLTAVAMFVAIGSGYVCRSAVGLSEGVRRHEPTTRVDR